MRSPFNFRILNGFGLWVLDKAIAPLQQKRRIVRPVYGPNIIIDLSLGDFFQIVVTNAVAFNINAPINDPGDEGTEMAIQIVNTSGGAMGAVTWNAIYKTFTGIAMPATGQARTFDLYRLAGTTGLTAGTWNMDNSSADTPQPA